MGLNKVLLYVGVVLFGFLLHRGSVGLAILLLVAALANGVWRVYCFMRDAREREAVQWGQIDIHTVKLDKKLD